MQFLTTVNVLNFKTMKQVWHRLLKSEATQNFQGMSAILMILLFLTFWGVSFYVLVNSLA